MYWFVQQWALLSTPLISESAAFAKICSGSGAALIETPRSIAGTVTGAFDIMQHEAYV